MPSRSEDVLLVKLRRDLADRLRQHAEGWQHNYAKGGQAPGTPDGKCLSITAIVEILLARDVAHRERSRRPRRVKYQG